MTKRQYNGVIVGAGRMGLTHLAILRTHPRVVIRALCDASATMGSRLAKQVGLRFSGDYEGLLDEGSLGFVVICTPTASHFALTREALCRGLHAFVEKPLTLTSAQSRELADLAAEKNLLLAAGYVNRFNDVFSEARRVLSKGFLGKPRHMRSVMYGRTVLRDVSSSWRGKKNKGGGVLREFGVHGLDLMQFLHGSSPEVLAARELSIHSGEVADAVYALLEWKDGLVGQVEINWSDPSYRKPSNLVEVYGDGGRLAVNQHELRVYVREDADEEYRRGWTVRYITDLLTPVRYYLRGAEFTRQLDDFVAAMDGDGAVLRSPGREAAKVDELVEQIEAFAGGSC